MDSPSQVFTVLPDSVLPDCYPAGVTELVFKDGLQPRCISNALRLAAGFGERRSFTVRWEGKLRWYPEFEKNAPFANVTKIVAIDGLDGVRVSDTTCSRASRFPDLRSVELSVKTRGDWCLADFFAMRHLARCIGVFTEQVVRRHMHTAGVCGYRVLDYEEGLPFRIDCCRDDCPRCADFAEQGEDMDGVLGWRWYSEEDEERRLEEVETKRSRMRKESAVRYDKRVARSSADSEDTAGEPKRRHEDSEEMLRREMESRKRFRERLRREEEEAERRRRERKSAATALPRRIASTIVVV